MFQLRQTTAHFSTTLGVCVPRSVLTTRDSILTTLCSEMFLLFVMLSGLTRERDHQLGRLLFNQVIFRSPIVGS